MTSKVSVIGGGLAGCEAAWQAAMMGANVTLYEMRPIVQSPAHKGYKLAELVCSNSLGSDSQEHPSGNLKQELRALGSLIMQVADATRVPAGGALAVDREAFSDMITKLIGQHPLIEIVRSEIKNPKDAKWPAVLATGPLTSNDMIRSLSEMLDSQLLYMYDAVAPIIESDSIDMDRVFEATRYGKGEPDYINCPMDKDQYLSFYEALINAERSDLSEGEDLRLFEACMPIEEMADRGVDTIRFGPMKPVGLIDPRTGRIPYAAVQLRKEDLPGSAYNIVGFQTRLKWSEQKRVFSMIPGLEQVRFIRFGVVHRNTYINSPALLTEGLMFKSSKGLFAAGQITGSEGYVESAATGALAGINAARFSVGEPLLMPPCETCIGALARYILTGKGNDFDPMSISFGLLPEPHERVKGRKEKRAMQIDAAKESLKEFLTSVGRVRNA